jgi:hypothetical protein
MTRACVVHHAAIALRPFGAPVVNLQVVVDTGRGGAMYTPIHGGARRLSARR